MHSDERRTANNRRGLQRLTFVVRRSAVVVKNKKKDKKN